MVDICDAGGTREILWYDVRNTSAAAGSYTVDTGSGTLLPLFDADTGMMVMPSKGDGSIRFSRPVNIDETRFACHPVMICGLLLCMCIIFLAQVARVVQ